MSVDRLKSEITSRVCSLQTLEEQEAFLVDRLQTRSDDAEGNYIFNTTLNYQDERSQLYALRLQIYDITLSLGGFIGELSAVDRAIADGYRFVLRQKILMRLDRLRSEERAYMEYGGNMVHIQNIQQLIILLEKSVWPLGSALF